MRVLSVIVHDNLDGNTLFCRSCRCLGSYQGRLSLCRKANLRRTYQAIKFATKEDVYKYLETKYQDTGEGLAKPFIMDNEKWVEMK